MNRWKIKIQLVLILFFLSFAIIFCSAQEFEVLNGSKMEIHGSSNVNQFTCIFPTNQIKPIQVDFNPDQLLFTKAEIKLPVASFDCGGHGINRDFKDLLQEKNHPNVKINLHKIDLHSSSEAKIHMTLEIAGIKNKYQLPVSYQKSNNRFQADATLPLNIEDFNLKQPRRLFGLIIVHKEIDIAFDLNFRSIKN